MLIDYKNLVNLPVETQGGQSLGKIMGLTLETESQIVYQYHVKPLGLGGFFAHELLIHRQQVVAISADKMIVEDLVYKKLASPASLPAKNPLPAEVVTSE